MKFNLINSEISKKIGFNKDILLIENKLSTMSVFNIKNCLFD